MQWLMLVIVTLVLSCVTPPIDAAQDAGPMDASATDARDDGDSAVSLCGDVILQQMKHPELVCSTDAECVTKSLGNACICELCVTSH